MTKNKIVHVSRTKKTNYKD